MEANEDSIRVGGWILTPDPNARTRNAGTRFEQAEQLRRFAESRSHQAMVSLHDDAQRKAPPHLEALESNPGMGVSTRTGNLVTQMGFEAAVAQIALVQGIPAWSAERALNRAEALATDLPEVLDALEVGRIGATHVDVIADQALRIKPRTIPAPDETDAIAVETWFRAVSAEDRAVKASRNELGRKLLDYADGRNPSAVRAKAKRLLQKYDPESFSKRSRRALDGRFFRVDPGNDGMAYLTVALESAKGEAIYDRVHRQAQVLKDESGDETPEERTMDQLRTDVFADHMLAGPHGSGLENVQAHVTLTVPADFLPDLGRAGSHQGSAINWAQSRPKLAGTSPDTAGKTPTSSGEQQPLGSGGVAEMVLPPGSDVPTSQRLGPMDQESTALLLANARSWWRILTDPFDGAVIDWAHDRYCPTPAQRRALAHRDNTCRTPGCNRPAARCEPDHTIEWQDGGTTDLNNLAMLCKRCHRLKSLGILTMRQLPDGTMVVTTLWGTTRKSTPEAAWAKQAIAAQKTTAGYSGGASPMEQDAGAEASRTWNQRDRRERPHAPEEPGGREGAGDPAGADSLDGAGGLDGPDTGDESWDPWDGPVPQPPPEVVDQLNAELFAWAEENLEWPPIDPEASAASWLDSQLAAEAQAEADHDREAGQRAWEAAGGEDYAWLMAELNSTDHTPQEDPSRPRRRKAIRPADPPRPRIRSMKRRQPLSITGAPSHRRTSMGVANSRENHTGDYRSTDPWAAWTTPHTSDPSDPDPPF